MGQKKISDLDHLSEIAGKRQDSGWEGPVYPLELSFLAATKMIDVATETTDEQMTTIKVNLGELLYSIFNMIYAALTNNPLLDLLELEKSNIQSAADAFTACVTTVLNSTASAVEQPSQE